MKRETGVLLCALLVTGAILNPVMAGTARVAVGNDVSLSASDAGRVVLSRVGPGAASRLTIGSSSRGTSGDTRGQDLNMGKSSTVAVEEAEPYSAVPTTVSLLGNRPNPFHGSTTIDYALPQSAHVAIDVFDLRGRRVASLVDGVQPAGWHSVSWRASEVAAGVYFYRLQVGSHVEVRRAITLD